jgi:hypothetical protein
MGARSQKPEARSQKILPGGGLFVKSQFHQFTPFREKLYLS